MPSNIWDVLGKAGEGAVKAAVANQNAQNTLKSQVMLYKIKNQFEQEAKKGEMKDKFGYDLAVKQAETPYQKWAMEQYQKEQAGGGNPGGRRMVPGATGFTTEKVNIKDVILGKIQKGEQLTAGELQIYNDTMKKSTGGGFKSMFDEGGEAPTGMPTSPATVLPQGITEEDIAHTMKLHSLTRDEVLSRIK
jgi:hypothetical protein